MTKTKITILSNFFTLWIPERGHIWSQETSKQIKMQKTQPNILHVKTNNVKRVQVIFRLKHKNIEILSYFYLKNAQKLNWRIFPKTILATFVKTPKNMFLWRK